MDVPWRYPLVIRSPFVVEQQHQNVRYAGDDDFPGFMSGAVWGFGFL